MDSIRHIEKLRSFLFVNRSPAQTLIKNSFWLTLGELAARASVFLVFILAARVLGPQDFGVFAFALGVAMLFSTFSDMGLSTYVVLRVARRKSSTLTILGASCALKVFLCLSTLLLLTACAYLVSSRFSEMLIIIILGVYVLGNSTNDFLRAVFRGLEHFQYETISKVIQGLLLLLFGVSVLFLWSSATTLAGSVAVAAVIAMFYSLGLVRSHLPSLHLIWMPRYWKLLLGKSWAFGLSGLLVSLSFHADSVILGLYRPDEEVGGYAAMYRILLFLILLISFLFTPFLPLLSRNQASVDVLRRANKYLFAMAAPIGVGLTSAVTLFREELAHILYGPQYADFSYLLLVLPLIFLCIALREPAAHTLAAIGKQHVSLSILVLSTTINVALNFALIPVYGPFGAALTTVSSEFLNLILFNYQLWKVLRVR